MFTVDQLKAESHLPGNHVAWIVREKLKKNRLVKMDAGWVKTCQKRMENP